MVLVLSIIFLTTACSEEATHTSHEPITSVYSGNTPPSSYINKESYSSSSSIFSSPTSDEFDTKYIGHKRKYFGKIGVVRELSARVEAGFVTLTWRQPYATPAVCFWVQYMRVPAEDIHRVDDVHPLSGLDPNWTLFLVDDGTSATIDGLLPGKTYLFRVQAQNFSGPGDFSENIGVIVAKSPHTRQHK